MWVKGTINMYLQSPVKSEFCTQMGKILMFAGQIKLKRATKASLVSPASHRRDNREPEHNIHVVAFTGEPVWYSG